MPSDHDQLFATLYADLHRLARQEMHRHPAQLTLGVTTLLHEAYLDVSRRHAVSFPDEAQFLAYAARAMRGVVIDRLRQRSAPQHGGAAAITSLESPTAEHHPQPDQLPAIGEALDQLEQLEPGLAQVVDLKFFCGFTMAQIAAITGSSERTVQRQWEKARLLLYRALGGG